MKIPRQAVEGALVAGGVYGEVSETKELVIIYKDILDTPYKTKAPFDPETGIWRVMTIKLDDVRIVTIPKGEAPYFKYGCGIDVGRSRIALDADAVPTLYLPEGWQLIGASANYAEGK